MTQPSKQIALRPVKGLPEHLESLLIELHNKLSCLKLSIPAGAEVPQIEASSAELIKRANDNLFSKITMEQPDEVDSTEKLEIKDFYKNYLIPGLAGVKHAFEQSDNLQAYLHINRANDLSETLDKIISEIKTLYLTDKNMQYTQVCELAKKIHQKIKNLLQNVNSQRNI